MALVLDASMMLSWYFTDERNQSDNLIRSLAEHEVHVPVHWLAEVANGILMGERRGRAEVGQIGHLFALLEVIDLHVDDEGAETALGRILPLARAHRLTVYDAIYLELAERRGLPLATIDAALAEAARSVGVTVLSSEAARP
jgi:predicted nucleic acid-binding protein